MGGGGAPSRDRHLEGPLFICSRGQRACAQGPIHSQLRNKSAAVGEGVPTGASAFAPTPLPGPGAAPPVQPCPPAAPTPDPAAATPTPGSAISPRRPCGRAGAVAEAGPDKDPPPTASGPDTRRHHPCGSAPETLWDLPAPSPLPNSPQLPPPSLGPSAESRLLLSRLGRSLAGTDATQLHSPRHWPPGLPVGNPPQRRNLF